MIIALIKLTYNRKITGTIISTSFHGFNGLALQKANDLSFKIIQCTKNKSGFNHSILYHAIQSHTRTYFYININKYRETKYSIWSKNKCTFVFHKTSSQDSGKMTKQQNGYPVKRKNKKQNKTKRQKHSEMPVLKALRSHKVLFECCCTTAEEGCFAKASWSQKVTFS